MITATLRLLVCMALIAALASIYISSRMTVPWAVLNPLVHSMNHSSSKRSVSALKSVVSNRKNSSDLQIGNPPNITTNCFRYNSQAWLEGSRRHGNAMVEPMADEYLNLTVLNLHELLKSSESTRQLLKQSICVEQSRFLNLTERTSQVDNDKKIRLWAIRLIYLAIHYHQHEPARKEAQLAVHGTCREERKAKKIGPFDFECPDTKFLVVSLWDNGIGANMGHIIVPALMAGLATNRVVLFLNKAPTRHTVMNRPWALASCRRRDAQCFFAPMTPCVLKHEDLASENVYSLNKQEKIQLFKDGVLPPEHKVVYMLGVQKTYGTSLGGKVEPSLRRISLLLINQLDSNDPRRPLLLQAADHILETDLPRSGYPFGGATSKIHHALQFYFLRPNLVYQQQLRQILTDLLPADFDPERAVGMPVRGESAR